MSPNPRVAVVTGAARGIGQAIALRLAETGHAVALGDVRSADETVAAIRDARGDTGTDGDTGAEASGRDAGTADAGRAAFAVRCDLGSPEGVGLLVREVQARFGRCDVLVNCAGLMLFRPFGELDLDTWQTIRIDGGLVTL